MIKSSFVLFKNVKIVFFITIVGADKCNWKVTDHEDYNIKLVYYHIMENLFDNRELWVEENWKKLCSLKIPQWVKVFL